MLLLPAAPNRPQQEPALRELPRNVTAERPDQAKPQRKPAPPTELFRLSQPAPLNRGPPVRRWPDMSATAFQMHWEHRKNRRATWYHCAARPEIRRPSRGACDALSVMKVHRLAHRAELCECSVASYHDAMETESASPARKFGPRGQTPRPRRRVPISSKTKEAIRVRAKNRCEGCKRPLAATRRITHPSVWAEARLKVFREYICRKCHKTFPAVLVELGEQVVDPWLKDDEIGRAVSQIFPSFFRDYSRTLRDRYWANHCPYCGAMQGGFRVSEYGGQESIIPLKGFRRKVQDSYIETKVTRWGHFHHINGDPADNKPENIALLCVRCHDSRHSKDSEPPHPGSGSSNA